MKKGKNKGIFVKETGFVEKKRGFFLRIFWFVENFFDFFLGKI